MQLMNNQMHTNGKSIEFRRSSSQSIETIRNFGFRILLIVGELESKSNSKCGTCDSLCQADYSKLSHYHKALSPKIDIE